MSIETSFELKKKQRRCVWIKPEKYAEKKINLYYKGLHCYFLDANIRNSIAHHNTESRLTILAKCGVCRFCSFFGEKLQHPSPHLSVSPTSIPGILSCPKALTHHALSPCGLVTIPLA